MKIKCKVCRRDIDVNEDDYKSGEKVTVECERCGNEIEVTIPEHDEKPAQKKIQTASSRITEESQVELVRDITQSESATVMVYSSGKEDLLTERGNTTPQINEEDSQEQLNNLPPIVTPTESDKKGNKWIFVVILLLLVCGAGGWWYYDNIYLPEKIDREAARTYPIVNINLRSSKMAGSDYNKISSVPYGGELITYNIDGEWADVKYVKPDGSESTKGYAASPYLVDKSDFYRLNSIFGDNESREILATSKVRRALLDYFKENGYVGKISAELMNEAGLSVSGDSYWHVVFPHGDKKPNEVVFKRLINPESKFTDMALLIKNINNGNRKLLYFYFDDDETPHFLGEMDAPREGTLKDVVNINGDITPIFAD